jgi:hypothetical protein
VFAAAGGEPADQVDDAAQRCLAGARRKRHHRRHRARIEKIRLDRLDPLVRLQALELALDDPWHDDPPAVVAQPPHDRVAKATRASCDDRGPVHSVAVRAPLYLRPT